MLKKCKSWARRFALVSGLLCAAIPFSACDDKAENVRVYDSSRLAPFYGDMNGDALYEILGASVVDKGVNFAVFAKNATRVEVLIFDSDKPDTDLPLTRIPMTKDEKSGIWTVYVQGIGVGTHYGYIAFGPNWPYDPDFKPGTTFGFKTDCDEQGNRYNPNKLLMDPYTRRIHRDFDWMSGGNPASGTARGISDWKSSPKSVVIKSEYQWSANEAEWRNNRQKGDGFKGHAQNDLIFYEAHPYGFTKSAISFKVGGKKNLDITINNPGTYRGIGEMAPYLADLGITALELMPPMEKPDDGGYWGYNTIQFFAPEWKYATVANQKKTNGVHDEFKEMVDKLHQNGIEVILDIVYNHTGEGGFWQSKVQDPAHSYGSQSTFEDKTAATLYSFRGLDNKSYYHLVKDSTGTPNQRFFDQTGVGNQPRANAKPFRRLIIDNLHFWVDEMHVDGFRFDLASILGVPDEQIDQDGDTSERGVPDDWFEKFKARNRAFEAHAKETVLQDIVDDDLLAKYHTRVIAEPWSVAHYVNGLFPRSEKTGNAWFEWNGRYRDFVRQFISDDNQNLKCGDGLSPNFDRRMELGNVLVGSSEMIGDDGRKPYNSVNFITVHDGFTLYDLNSYNEKHNGCSLLNNICCSDPYNAFCKTDSGEDNNHSHDWCGGNKDSQGACNDSGGEAYKRQIIRNYFAMLLIGHGSPLILGGDEYMRTQFGNNDAYSDSANNEWNWFRWGDWLQDEARVRMHDFVRDMIALRKQYKAFLSPTEYDSTGLEWHGPDGVSTDAAWDGRAIAQYYPARDNTPALFIMINLYENQRTFWLPGGGDWNILVDTQVYRENEGGKNTFGLGELVVSDGKYGVAGRSIVIATKQ